MQGGPPHITARGFRSRYVSNCGCGLMRPTCLQIVAQDAARGQRQPDQPLRTSKTMHTWRPCGPRCSKLSSMRTQAAAPSADRCACPAIAASRSISSCAASV